MTAIVRTRFAPSPTGLLHLGNARTAFYNFLLAQQKGGQFVIRSEDTDRDRSRESLLDDLLADMTWLGLNWEEGPDKAGVAGPYRQSERDAIYGERFQVLERRGLAYPCYCSQAELAASRRAQQASGRPPRYPGTCRTLSGDERTRRNAAGERPTLRFQVPDGVDIEFDDLVRGAQKFASADIGDFVVRRSDGTPAFFFSNAVDDALMGITHVLRGEDHLTNTPRQLLLLSALELEAPRYGHMALIVDADGTPLSKRRGSSTLRDFIERGFLPVALQNYMARLGHHLSDAELLAIDDIVGRFVVSGLGRAPARFDESQLLHWQKLAVLAATDDELLEWLADGERKIARIPRADRIGFVSVIRENIVLPEDAAFWVDCFFGDMQLTESAKAIISLSGGEFFQAAARAARDRHESFREFAREVGNATGRKGKQLFLPLRAAITGATDGPEMQRIFAMIGAARVEGRLKTAAEIAGY